MAKLIAEFKRQSPWDGPLTGRPLEEIVELYDAVPEVWGVSVVADERWGGSVDDIRRARRSTSKPLLARGLELCPWKAANLGADFALTYSISCALDLSPLTWLEVFSAGDLKRVEALGRGWPGIVVANNRDVRTGNLSRGNAEAVKRAIPPGTLVCAASGYRNVDEASWADFVIVGTSVLRRMG